MHLLLETIENWTENGIESGGWRVDIAHIIYYLNSFCDK